MWLLQYTDFQDSKIQTVIVEDTKRMGYGEWSGVYLCPMGIGSHEETIPHPRKMILYNFKWHIFGKS